jgi:hypothetical protein
MGMAEPPDESARKVFGDWVSETVEINVRTSVRRRLVLVKVGGQHHGSAIDTATARRLAEVLIQAADFIDKRGS